ncbi:hypothetical protein D3C86_1857110 [compost metagenome]
MTRIGEIRKFHFPAIIPDSGFQFKLELILFRTKTEEVICQGCGCIQEQLTVKLVVPPQSNNSVTPGHPHIEIILLVTEIEQILPVISAQINFVFRPQAVIHFGIQIVEKIAGAIEITRFFEESLHEYIDVRPSCRNNE